MQKKLTMASSKRVPWRKAFRADAQRPTTLRAKRRARQEAEKARNQGPTDTGKAAPPKVVKPKKLSFLTNADGKARQIKLKLTKGGDGKGYRHSVYLNAKAKPTAAEMKAIKAFVAEADLRKQVSSPFRAGFAGYTLLNKAAETSRFTKDGKPWTFSTRGSTPFAMQAFADLATLLAALKTK